MKLHRLLDCPYIEEEEFLNYFDIFSTKEDKDSSLYSSPVSCKYGLRLFLTAPPRIKIEKNSVNYLFKWINENVEEVEMDILEILIESKIKHMVKNPYSKKDELNLKKLSLKEKVTELSKDHDGNDQLRKYPLDRNLTFLISLTKDICENR